MDDYSFMHKGKTITVTATRATAIKGTVNEWFPESAFYAEILKLAEERDNFKRSSEWDSEQRDLANEALRLAEEERDAAQMTAEEGQEIVGELAMSLAVIAGETLTACGDRDGKCPGHLGPKAREAADGAWRIYHALQEGNRQAVARAGELEAKADRLLVEARRGSELTGILQEHAKGEESPADILGRIIRERQELTNVRVLYRATLVALEREKQSCETIESTVERIIHERNFGAALADSRMAQIVPLRRRLEEAESENRAKCLELAEKAGEIRELQEARDELYRRWVQSSERVARLRSGWPPAAKLLALLDSEDWPVELETHIGERSGLKISRLHQRIIAAAAWRWLREQVVES